MAFPQFVAIPIVNAHPEVTLRACFILKAIHVSSSLPPTGPNPTTAQPSVVSIWSRDKK
jgi:hypothetical protein